MFFSPGADSPVSMDSSTADSPSTTLASVGTRSPGRKMIVPSMARSFTGTNGFAAIAMPKTSLGRRQFEQLPQRGWKRGHSRAIPSNGRR